MRGRRGINLGMIDVGKSHEVLRALGQAPLDALGKAVELTRADQDEYRSTLPRLSARHTQRGWLNWVHDQFFANMLVAVDEKCDDATVRDLEPRREIYFGSLFRFRFKKHDEHDFISSYQTDGYLDFTQQDPPQLLQEIRLIGGYRWDREVSQIGAPLVSARDGHNRVLWVYELEASSGSGGATHFAPKPPSDWGGPNLPVVEAMKARVRREGEAPR